MSSFGQRLKERRKALEISQEELARLCGWDDQSRVSQYERGRRTPSIDDVIKIAQAMQSDPAYLLFGSGRVVVKGEGKQHIGEGGYVVVPLFTIDALGRWLHKQETKPMQMLPCPLEVGPNAFAVVVSGSANLNLSEQQSLSEGDVVFGDPWIAPAGGKMVVVGERGTMNVMIRRLVIDGGRRYLEALNPSWPERIVEVNERHEILATLVGRFEGL